MSRGPNGVVLWQLRTLFGAGSAAGLSDAELLERFAGRRGEAAEAAFSALVERHGPMVLRVCRRVLADPHDAEDAFQAVFLVLVRRAGTIRRGGSVGCWLHGVALRVSACARVSAARRRLREREGAEMKARPVEGGGDDLGPMLHEEIGRLPGHYRAAVVLCCLEGLTHEEAARQLGWPVGTVKSRLARGREKLRERLTRRGIMPTAVAVAAALAAESASAALPERSVGLTVRAAFGYAAGGAAAAGLVSASVVALADGAISMMILTKWKVAAAAVVAFGLVAAGASVTAQQPTLSAPASEDSDRLEQMNRKIDRLLQALEGRSLDAEKTTARVHGHSIKAATPPHTDSAVRAENPGGSRSIDDRLSDVENRLTLVERKLERLVDLHPRLDGRSVQGSATIRGDRTNPTPEPGRSPFDLEPARSPSARSIEAAPAVPAVAPVPAAPAIAPAPVAPATPAPEGLPK